MENVENKLDLLLRNLSKQKPELSDAEHLTDNIINVIKSKSRAPKPSILIWIRAVSGAAAILLVGLFLFQQNESETIASTNKSIPVLEKKINTDSLCSDNPESPAKTYFCYMRQNSIKNNQLTTYSQQLTN